MLMFVFLFTLMVCIPALIGLCIIAFSVYSRIDALDSLIERIQYSTESKLIVNRVQKIPGPPGCCLGYEFIPVPLVQAVEFILDELEVQVERIPAKAAAPAGARLYRKEETDV